jgi:hypothetical protein
MKPRTLRTYKILAVAVTAAAGCTRPAAPDAEAEPRQAAAPPVTAQVQAAAATPAPAPLAKEALEALRDELSPLGRDKALQQMAHFRPLCDKDGYPLVGNLMRKVAGEQYQPSELCEEVRKTASR